MTQFQIDIFSEQFSEIEEERFTVYFCMTAPYCPGIAPSLNSPGEPPDAPEFEIDTIEDSNNNKVTGEKLNYLLALAYRDYFDKMYEASMER